MSVLINGMEMPKSCPCGLVGVGYAVYCSFTSGVPSRVREYAECCAKETRPDWCPIDTVVHCKDCKYCEHTLKRPNVWMPNETSEDHYNCMRIENGTKPIVFPDSFCSFGKRGEMRVTL